MSHFVFPPSSPQQRKEHKPPGLNPCFLSRTAATFPSLSPVPSLRAPCWSCSGKRGRERSKDCGSEFPFFLLEGFSSQVALCPWSASPPSPPHTHTDTHTHHHPFLLQCSAPFCCLSRRDFVRAQSLRSRDGAFLVRSYRLYVRFHETLKKMIFLWG